MTIELDFDWPSSLQRGHDRTFLEGVPRTETTRVHVTIGRKASTLLLVRFVDPTPADSVEVRFLFSDDKLWFPGDTATAPSDHLYMVGHGVVSQSGVVAKITGQVTGQGMGAGNDQSFDLDVEVFDELKAEGITAHSMFAPSEYIVEFVHSTAQPVTYGALFELGLS